MLTYDVAMHPFRTPGGHTATMYYRLGTNDWNTLYSSLDGDEYGLPTGLTGKALDIGGYLGSVGIALALDNPGLRVVIVEPVPPNCDLITRNIHENGVADRVTLLQGAVGRKGTAVNVSYGFRGNPSAEHHAFVGNCNLFPSTEYETVHYNATTLAGLVGLAGGHVPYMKIDVEGGEWDFLVPPATRDVDVIVGEWHSVRGETQADLLDRLGETHTVTFSGPVGGPGGFRAERKTAS